MKLLIKINWSLLPLMFIIFMVGNPAILTAQDTTIKKSADVVLLSPSLELISIQNADKSIDLKASMRTKFKGSSIRLPHLKVKFLQVADTSEKELGYMITDRLGVALFNFKGDAIKVDKDGKVKFKAVFDGNKYMEPVDAEVYIKRGNLSLEPVKADSNYSVILKLINLTMDTAIPDATVSLYVKRSFFPMKIGEGKTEADGTVSIEVPKNINGDSIGNITLIARLDENEEYGTLEGTITKNWGVPVSNINQELPRALWSSHPPTWMLITFIVLMTTVWGHYIVIVYELFRLRNEEPKIITESNA